MLSSLVDLFYSSLPFRIAVGLLVGLLSSLYSRRNSHDASRDALAYAAKTRLQKEAAAAEREIQERSTKDDPPTLESNVVVSNASEKDKKPTEGSERTADGDSIQQDRTCKKASRVEKDKSGDDDTDMADIMSSFSSSNNNQWRCACEGGFLPAGLLQSLGGAEAVFRMGTGQCYHKQT